MVNGVEFFRLYMPGGHKFPAFLIFTSPYGAKKYTVSHSTHPYYRLGYRFFLVPGACHYHPYPGGYLRYSGRISVFP